MLSMSNRCWFSNWDEFYQSTDVVHNFVLNQTEVTWEWHYPIRTSLWLYPAAMFCRFVHFLGLYTELNVQTFLRLYTGLICAFGELIMADLAGAIFSPEVGKSYFVLASSSWYQFYSGSKALNNPVEVTLFSLTFFQLYKDGHKSSRSGFYISIELQKFIYVFIQYIQRVSLRSR